MSLLTYAHRVGASMRAALHPAPADALQRMLKRGRHGGLRYVRACHELGLARRAAEALSALAAQPARAVPPSVTLRQALLEGHVDAARTQALGLLAATPAPGPRECEALATLLAPVDAGLALRLLEAGGIASPMEPALRLRCGDAAGAAARLEALGARLGAQRWLLWANLQDRPADRLEGLNRCLAACGLQTATLRDPQRPPSVTNLDAAVPPSASAGAASRLSVVMTCFDAEEHLAGALRSVLDQSHRELELIAVDDASRDGTWPRLQAAARADARVRAVRLARNAGTYVAKNVGLALARGEFVAFQDADDWSHPQRFERCLAVLARRAEVVSVSGLTTRLQDDGVFWSARVWPLLRWNPNPLLFRREPVLRALGAFDEHRFGADSEFAARIEQWFGYAATVRLRAPLMLAARRENSLTTAQGSGLDASGRSQARHDYQERWREELVQRGLDGASLRREAVDGTPALIAEIVEGTPRW
jgi:hypothetical protein